jgi:hypothetical protein
MVGRVAWVRAMDQLSQIVPIIGIRVRAERIGTQLKFELIIQSVVISVIVVHDRPGEAPSEGGQGGESEQERKREEEKA